MQERRIIGSFGYCVGVFRPVEPVATVEKILAKLGRPKLEMVHVLSGVMEKDVARGMAQGLNEGHDGLVYKAVREIPPGFIV